MLDALVTSNWTLSWVHAEDCLDVTLNTDVTACWLLWWLSAKTLTLLQSEHCRQKHQACLELLWAMWYMYICVCARQCFMSWNQHTNPRLCLSRERDVRIIDVTFLLSGNSSFDMPTNFCALDLYMGIIGAGPGESHAKQKQEMR